MGGPIKKDKAFFFLAYEGTRQSLSATQIANVPDANARLGILPTGNVTVNTKVAPYLPLFPMPTPGGRNFGDGTAQFIFQSHQPTEENFGQGRVDYQVSASDSLFLRFSSSNALQTNTVGYPDFTQTSSLGSTLATLSETHIISPTSLNTFRFHFNRVVPLDTATFPTVAPELLSAPGQSIPPQLAPGSGITPYAGFATPPTYFISNRFTFQDDVNKTIGAHSLQFGGMFERLQFNGEFPNRFFGVWTFTSLQNFLTGTLSSYRGAPPGYGTYIRGFRQNFFALYVQDNWRLNAKVTLNLGVRWEPYSVPTEVNGLIANLRHADDATGTVGGPYWLNKSMKDIGPRIGVVYSPFASGKTSIRAGAGLLFEPNDPNLFYTQMVRMPPLAYDFTFTTNLAGTFPNALAAIAAQTSKGPGYSIPYDNNKSPRAIQYNVNLQQQLGSNNVISLGYTGSRGRNLLSVGDYNVPRAEFDGVSLAFPLNAAIRNPNWSQIVIYANNASSWYNALLFSYQRKFANGFQGQISYTWSKGLAEADSGQTAGGVTSSGGYVKYPLDLRASRGLSGYDFRQLFSANYSYDLPFGKGTHGAVGHVISGWQTTGIISIQAGQPFSVLAALSTALSQLQVNNRSPNLVAGTKYKDIVNGGPDKYFNVSAYQPAGTRELGNVGRNTLIGPGLITWNPGLLKNDTITERIKSEFRVEMFNVLNRANFGAPASSVFTATGGPNNLGTPVGSAGVISNTVTTARQIQLSLKLLF